MDKRVREELSFYSHAFRGMGLVSTDGVQRTGVVSFGTAALTVFDELIDPGQDWWLRKINVGLTQKFTEVASLIGSLFYYWQARSEYKFPGTAGLVATIRGYVNLTGTYTKSIAALANSEDTFSGDIDVGSLPGLPARFQLIVQGGITTNMVAQLKNSSFVEFLGTVIPGVG